MARHQPRPGTPAHLHVTVRVRCHIDHRRSSVRSGDARDVAHEAEKRDDPPPMTGGEEGLPNYRPIRTVASRYINVTAGQRRTRRQHENGAPSGMNSKRSSRTPSFAGNSSWNGTGWKRSTG